MKIIGKRGSRRGVVGAWMVVGMLSFIGMAALVVDVGRLIVAAQHAQAVADGAALAGARQLPDQSAAQSALQGLVQANNQETASFTVQLTPNSDVSFYGAGQAITGYGALEDNEHACEVTCRVAVDYTFARIFGMQSSTVERSATALATPGGGGDGGGGGGVFFAQEPAAHLWGVVINGAKQTVGGDIHSNTRVVINGSHQTVTGTIEYRHECTIHGAHQDIGDTQEGEIEPYPVDYDWDDFYVSGPYDYVHNNAYYNGNRQALPTGDWKINGNLSINGTRFTASDSTFMIGGNMYLNGSSFSAENCLFMSDNYIYVSGAKIDFDNCTLIARQGIYFNSAMKECSYKRDCDGLFAMAEGIAGITYNGAKQTTEGIIYAPNGPIIYNGAKQEVYSGGLAAKTITINGAQSIFNPHEEYGFGGSSGGEATVSLIK